MACKAAHATDCKYASHATNVRPVRSTCSLFASIPHTESKRSERRVLIRSVIKCCGGEMLSPLIYTLERRKNVRPTVRGAARGRLSENGIGIERPVVWRLCFLSSKLKCKITLGSMVSSVYLWNQYWKTVCHHAALIPADKTQSWPALRTERKRQELGGVLGEEMMSPQVCEMHSGPFRIL